MDTQRLVDTIQQGRGYTANLSGLTEFWECAKTVPLSRINECLDELQKGPLVKPGDKLPISVSVKPDWLWFSLGFIACWILKR